MSERDRLKNQEKNLTHKVKEFHAKYTVFVQFHQTPEVIRPHDFEPRGTFLEWPYDHTPSIEEVLKKIEEQKDINKRPVSFLVGKSHVGKMKIGDRNVNFWTGQIESSGNYFFDAELFDPQMAEEIIAEELIKDYSFASTILGYRLGQLRQKNGGLPENIKIVKTRTGYYEVFDTEKDHILQSQEAKDREVLEKIEQQRQEKYGTGNI